MFSIRPLYPNLPFQSRFQPSPVTETDLAGLNNLIKDKLKSEDFGMAMLIAERMALYHGVPGIINYVNASLGLIQKSLDEGEVVEATGFNSLLYLELAKLIYDSDPMAKTNMERVMPEENKDFEKYYKTKKTELIELADLKGLEKEAKDGAATLFKTSQDEKRLSI